MKKFILAAVLVAAAATVRAEQPACTGDRHLDECGQNCPVSCCPETTTTTTLPGGGGECQACEPVLPCPDPAPCQPVVCENGMDGTSTVVTVDRCPEPEVIEVCKVHRNGEVECPRSKKTRHGKPGPRRIYVPRSIIDKIATVEHY